MPQFQKISQTNAPQVLIGRTLILRRHTTLTFKKSRRRKQNALLKRQDSFRRLKSTKITSHRSLKAITAHERVNTMRHSKIQIGFSHANLSAPYCRFGVSIPTCFLRFCSAERICFHAYSGAFKPRLMTKSGFFSTQQSSRGTQFITTSE